MLKLTGSVFKNMGPTARIFGQNLNGSWTEPLVGVYTPLSGVRRRVFVCFWNGFQHARVTFCILSGRLRECPSASYVFFLLTIIFVHLCLTFSFTVISLRHIVLNTYTLGWHLIFLSPVWASRPISSCLLNISTEMVDRELRLNICYMSIISQWSWGEK